MILESTDITYKDRCSLPAIKDTLKATIYNENHVEYLHITTECYRQPHRAPSK